jgi:hypothetical protein
MGIDHLTRGYRVELLPHQLHDAGHMTVLGTQGGHQGEFGAGLA